MTDGRARRRFGVVSRVLGRPDLPTDVAAAAQRGRRRHERRAHRAPADRGGRGTAPFDDAGLAVSSVVSIGPALAGGATGPIDAELAMLDAAAEFARTGVLASTGPLGDVSSRDADARCRAWLERLALRAVELGVVVMLEPMFPMFRDHSYVHTFAHTLDLVADLDGATVVVDTGHLWWDPRLVELFHAHLADIGTVQLTNISTSALGRLRYSRAPFAHWRDPAPRPRPGVRRCRLPRLVRARGADEGTGGPCAVRPRLAGVVPRDLELKDQHALRSE